MKKVRWAIYHCGKMAYWGVLSMSVFSPHRNGDRKNKFTVCLGRLLLREDQQNTRIKNGIPGKVGRSWGICLEKVQGREAGPKEGEFIPCNCNYVFCNLYSVICICKLYL